MAPKGYQDGPNFAQVALTRHQFCVTLLTFMVTPAQIYATAVRRQCTQSEDIVIQSKWPGLCFKSDCAIVRHSDYIKGAMVRMVMETGACVGPVKRPKKTQGPHNWVVFVISIAHLSVYGCNLRFTFKKQSPELACTMLGERPPTSGEGEWTSACSRFALPASTEFFSSIQYLDTMVILSGSKVAVLIGLGNNPPSFRYSRSDV